MYDIEVLPNSSKPKLAGTMRQDDELIEAIARDRDHAALEELVEALLVHVVEPVSGRPRAEEREVEEQDERHVWRHLLQDGVGAGAASRHQTR